MIRRRDFDQTQEAIELSPSHRQPHATQRLDRGIEMRLGLPRGLRTELAHLFEIPQRAVALTLGDQRGSELKPHGEIGGCALQHLAQPRRVALLPAIATLALELPKRIQRSRVCREPRQQRSSFRRPAGQGIELRKSERDINVRGIEPPRPLEL